MKNRSNIRKLTQNLRVLAPAALGHAAGGQSTGTTSTSGTPEEGDDTNSDPVGRLNVGFVWF